MKNVMKLGKMRRIKCLRAEEVLTVGIQILPSARLDSDLDLFNLGL